MSRESDRAESDEDDDSNEGVPFSKCRFPFAVSVMPIVFCSVRIFVTLSRFGGDFEEDSREYDGSSTESRVKSEFEVEEDDRNEEGEDD